MKNVVTRSISGLVYVAIFVGCILLGRWTYLLLTEVLIVLGLVEYMRLAERRIGEPIDSIVFGLSLILGMGCPIIAVGSYIPLFLFVTGPFLVFLCAIPIILLFRAVISKSPNALRMSGTAFTAFFYITLPLSMLMYIYTISGSPLQGTSASTLILNSLIGIWINDTGAFCVGTLFGKRRLCERLSPKKSWEGFWGGLAFVVIFFVILGICYSYSIFDIIICGIYGALLSVFATFGDLFESLLKRSAGVKDSGKLIPGHGGILDRIDSFLFVAYLLIFSCALGGVFAIYFYR